MTVYRVLKRLDRGSKGVLECGILIIDRDWPSNYIDRLVEVQAIAPVSAPPLNVLPGVGERDEALTSVGIETIDQLLEASDEGLMRALDIDAIQLAQLRADVVRWLTVTDLKSC
jgi:hypothetical protein